MLVCYLYSSYPPVSYAELLPFKGTSSSGAEFKGAIPVTEMKPNFNHKLTPTTQHCSKTFSAAQVLANSFCYTVQTFKIYQVSWLGWGVCCFHFSECFRSSWKQQHLLYKEKIPVVVKAGRCLWAVTIRAIRYSFPRAYILKLFLLDPQELPHSSNIQASEKHLRKYQKYLKKMYTLCNWSDSGTWCKVCHQAWQLGSKSSRSGTK